MPSASVLYNVTYFRELRRQDVWIRSLLFLTHFIVFKDTALFSDCSFLTSIDTAYFNNATLTCNQINAGTTEQCTLARNSYFFIDQNACNSVGGSFSVSSTGSGTSTLAPSGTLTVSCSSDGVLSVSGSGVTTQTGVTSIGCLSNGCSSTISGP